MTDTERITRLESEVETLRTALGLAGADIRRLQADAESTRQRFDTAAEALTAVIQIIETLGNLR